MTRRLFHYSKLSLTSTECSGTFLHDPNQFWFAVSTIDLDVAIVIKSPKIDCLRFVMHPLQAPVFKGFFFVVAINSTNEANKVGGMHL
jgi:hypothetical protein